MLISNTKRETQNGTHKTETHSVTKNWKMCHFSRLVFNEELEAALKAIVDAASKDLPTTPWVKGYREKEYGK